MRISDWSSDVCSSDLLEADGKNKRWEYQGSFDVGDRITAIFGVENERSSFRSRSPSASLATPLPDFVRGEAELTSAYGQLSVEPLNGLTLNGGVRSEEHTSELQSLMRISYAVFCLKKKKDTQEELIIT